MVILHDEVFGEFDDVVLLVVDEVVVEVAIKLSTGNKEWWVLETVEGRWEAGGGETSLDVEEELSAGGTATLMCLKTFCHMVA